MIENTLLAIGVVLTMLSSIATTIIGVIRAINEAKKEDNDLRATAAKAPIDRRRSELELADQIREITGKMIADLREDVDCLREDISERDTQIGQLEERLRFLLRESRRMQAALEEALDIARTVMNDRPGGSAIMARIIEALERGLQPITPSQDTGPLNKPLDTTKGKQG